MIATATRVMDLLSTGIVSKTALGVDAGDAGVFGDTLVTDGAELVGIAVRLLAGASISDVVGITVTTTSVLINSLLPG